MNRQDIAHLQILCRELLRTLCCTRITASDISVRLALQKSLCPCSRLGKWAQPVGMEARRGLEPAQFQILPWTASGLLHSGLAHHDVRVSITYEYSRPMHRRRACTRRGVPGHPGAPASPYSDAQRGTPARHDCSLRFELQGACRIARPLAQDSGRCRAPSAAHMVGCLTSRPPSSRYSRSTAGRR